MSTEPASPSRVAGAKQVRRAIESGRVLRLYIAQDADPRLLQPLVQKCVDLRIPIEQVSTMRRLGEACGIAVGAAVAAAVK